MSLPVASRLGIMDPPASRTAAVAATHAEPDAALIKEDQTLRVNPLQAATPTLAFLTDIFAALLTGVERFF